jgi:hypothetical protein
MRFVSLAVLSFAAACASRAPIDVAPAPAAVGPIIALPCDWPVGTTVYYRYEWRRADSRTPGSEQVASVSPAVLTVTGKDRLRLDIGAEEQLGPPELVDSEPSMEVVFEPPPIELVVKDGQLIDVANREEAVNAILTQLEAMWPPEDFEWAKEMYGDPKTATQSLLEDPEMLLGTICMAMGDNEHVETSFERPPRMGGPPLLTLVTIDATIRAEEGTATYVLNERIDPKSMDKMTRGIMKDLASEAGVKTPPVPSVDSKTVIVALHSLADGLPISVDTTQTTVVGDNLARREDRWIWTRVTGP